MPHSYLWTPTPSLLLEFLISVKKNSPHPFTYSIPMSYEVFSVCSKTSVTPVLFPPFPLLHSWSRFLILSHASYFLPHIPRYQFKTQLSHNVFWTIPTLVDTCHSGISSAFILPHSICSSLSSMGLASQMSISFHPFLLSIITMAGMAWVQKSCSKILGQLLTFGHCFVLNVPLLQFICWHPNAQCNSLKIGPLEIN